MIRSLTLVLFLAALIPLSQAGRDVLRQMDADTSGVGTFADPLNTVDGSRQAKEDT